MSISRTRLLELVMSVLLRRGCDRDPLWLYYKYLIEQVIMNDPTKGCRFRSSRKEWAGFPSNKTLFGVDEGHGLPIGNLTSQLFSNVFLNVFDQYVKRVLKCRHYVRYVDDFCIVAGTREELKALIEPIRCFLYDNLGLVLHPDKVWLHRQEEGVPFLGYVVANGRRKMSKRGSKSLAASVTDALCFEVNPYSVRATINSYEGYVRHFDYGYRRWKDCIVRM